MDIDKRHMDDGLQTQGRRRLGALGGKSTNGPSRLGMEEHHIEQEEAPMQPTGMRSIESMEHSIM